MEPIIQVKDVYFDYNQSRGEQTVALDGVSWIYIKGEFVVIIGHNGSESPPWPSISMHCSSLPPVRYLLRV